MLMYAGIKGVPPELNEAAMIDGCTEGQVNRYIIIPYTTLFRSTRTMAC